MTHPQSPEPPSALVVIDMQRAFVTGPDAVPQAERVVAAVDLLLARARESGALVVHLQNDGPTGAPDEPGTAGWGLATEPLRDETVIRKYEDDGFVGTDLEEVLRRHDAHSIVVCGVQSEMCVAATARAAMARGMTVLLPRDAHGTYPIPDDGEGGGVTAPDVARVAEWSLGDEAVVVQHSDQVTFSCSRS